MTHPLFTSGRDIHPILSRGSGVAFLSTAENLANQIWENRVYARDGSVTWIRPGSPGRGEQADLRVRVDPYLHDGTAGIALFLAAIANVTHSRVHHDRSLLAIAPVRRKVAQLTEDPERTARLRHLPIGGMIGLGSLIYCFLRMGELLDEPAMIVEAHDLLTLMTPERVARDEYCDILYGSAGAILSLLALHRAMPSPSRNGVAPLEISLACALNLLSRQVSTPGGHRAWRTLPGLPPLTGFSHGNAGICHALLRLYELTGEVQLLQAAREGLDFERTLFSSEHKNWLDLRFPTSASYETSWCTGAPGIALSRLRILAILDTQEIREDAWNGIETTLATPMNTLDYVCCGNMGRVETLFCAYLISGDQQLRKSAENLAVRILHRMEINGHLGLRPEMKMGLFDPTFFTGVSGIGYTLLRLMAPDALSSVLLLE